MIIGLSPDLFLDYLYSEFLGHVLKIGVNALALGGYVVFGELVQDLTDGQRVLVVGLFKHDLHKVRELKLLIAPS